jgi:mRNA-degrading endonuclease toxin of MazEF toxin-antitoxin module
MSKRENHAIVGGRRLWLVLSEVSGNKALSLMSIMPMLRMPAFAHTVNVFI